MTCIVGLVHEGSVYMGADSAASDGWLCQTTAAAKVFRNDGYLIGYTTSFRFGQLLEHAFTPPSPTGRLEKFLTTTFVDALRTCLKDGGFAEKDKEREAGGQFLVGVAGRLFMVGSDYQVSEPGAPYASVGSGYLAALGAMHATADVEEYRARPRRRVLAALAAAGDLTGTVKAPYVCKRLGGGGAS